LEKFFFDVIIVGGGLAGLTSSIHLSSLQKQVLLIEKQGYPRHRVCGEYDSNEVLPYLMSLGINPIEKGAKKITEVHFSTSKSELIKSTLPVGGFGISRFFFDNLLMKKACLNGVRIIQDTVDSIDFIEDKFYAKTNNSGTFYGKVAIGAFGKRSSLDHKMKRKFTQKKSPYLAVKTHAIGSFPENLVALHNFNGGYCGVSKVETDIINLCYISDYKSFKKYKNVKTFQEQVVFKNDFLRKIFKETKPVFDKPLTISQISFEKKKPVENHVIMCGDSAGMIHPLCGNGMAMAIISAQIASKRIIEFLNGEIKSREILEKHYIRDWNRKFRIRLKTGRLIAWLLRNQLISQFMYLSLKLIPSLLPKIIRLTHGKKTSNYELFN